MAESGTALPIIGGLFGRAAADDLPSITHGEGVMLWDDAGREYIDSTSGAIAVISIGHGVEEVVEAMAAQARKVAYVQGGRFRNDVAEELAGELARLTPGDLNRAIFISGGSEANETAIKLARAYQLAKGRPERYVVLSRERSYHGNTLGALSVSGFAARRADYQPLLLWEPRVARQNCYRCPFELTYPGCGLACADDLERAIQEVGPERVSAFIAEPIVGAAGAATTPPPGYFERVRAICDMHDILFIADEVVTGLGRTGKNFGMDHWGVAPDIIVTAKGLSGGYVPLGAVLVSERVEQAFAEAGTRFTHGYTYMQHPVTCAAGLAVLRIIERDRLVQNAAVQGERMFAQLDEKVAPHPFVGDLRGKGLLAGIELVADRETKRPFAPEARVTQQLLNAALARGIMLYPCASGDGPHSDQVLLSPPLTVSADEIDLIVERLALALRDVEPALAESAG